ncbi:hypothetical protein [Pedobacter aquatilis]|nr:hypothetical protein [Pedobacter aquatilis]
MSNSILYNLNKINAEISTIIKYTIDIYLQNLQKVFARSAVAVFMI